MSDIRDLGQRYIAALWDAVGVTGFDATKAQELAGLVAAVAEAESQLAGWRLHVLHEAHLSSAEAVVEEVRHSVRTNPAQATATLRLASDLGDRFPLIASALNDGVISLAQTEAIVDGLKKLPGRLTRAELLRCQEHILGHVDALGPAELRTLAARLVELIDPQGAEEDEAKRMAAQERDARRSRFLRLSPDFHGSVRITGKIPVADAALLSAQLEALMPPASSYTDTNETSGPEVRRADALVLLTQAAAASGQLPAHGCDRPQVHVTVNYETLISGLGRVALLGANGTEGVSAAEARRLACDAGLIPMVLGTGSRPLDVGRERRLFTPAMRAALVQRDQGCAFPGCSVSPSACEAHHIVPWWAGGPTSVANGVLLCPFHHRLVEPDPQQSSQSQWEVHLDAGTGTPWFTPPRHIDPRRRARQHTRHRLEQLPPPARAPLCPPPDDGPTLADLIQRSAAIWS